MQQRRRSSSLAANKDRNKAPSPKLVYNEENKEESVPNHASGLLVRWAIEDHRQAPEMSSARARGSSAIKKPSSAYRAVQGGLGQAQEICDAPIEQNTLVITGR